jgi:hypothetical protein
MKNVIIVIIILVAGLLAYNYFTTGKLTLIPGSSMSEEEEEIAVLEREFKIASREFRQAQGGAAIGGIDTTSEADAAYREVERIEKALTAMQRKLKEPAAKERAKELQDRITHFKELAR